MSVVDYFLQNAQRCAKDIRYAERKRLPIRGLVDGEWRDVTAEHIEHLRQAHSEYLRAAEHWRQ